MTAAIVSQPVDEVTVFQVPAPWERFPQEWQERLGYWYVIQALQMQEHVVIFGPPRDLHWTISRDPAVIRAIELRHECDDCRDAQTKAVELLESDNSRSLIAFVQFVQDYLYPIENVPTEFAATGVSHER